MPRSACVAALVSSVQAVRAQIPPSYDFNFATIAEAGNAPFPGGPGPYPVFAGRGSVGYEYRIARVEVTTAQWMEFVNTYSVLGGGWTHFAEPVFWGAAPDPTYSGPGMRWRLDPSIPDSAMLPVGGISWREGAKYCNWLHNEKAPTTAALENGAYDTATFGSAGGTLFTDQWHHNPGARFWIPTLDEWLKAVHFDPNRFGPGSGGWWHYSYGSSSPPVPGLPGAGQTSASQDIVDAWMIPLGAYAQMQSPWGLWDTSGGSSELTEGVFTPEFPSGRFVKGSAFGVTGDMEPIWGFSTIHPGTGASHLGLRIASAVPSPSTAIVLVVLLVPVNKRRRAEHARRQRSRI